MQLEEAQSFFWAHAPWLPGSLLIGGVRVSRASRWTRHISGMAAAYRLVLIRHGESAWNLENRFSGWYDADLSPAGQEEAQRGGEALRGEEMRSFVEEGMEMLAKWLLGDIREGERGEGFWSSRPGAGWRVIPPGKGG